MCFPSGSSDITLHTYTHISVCVTVMRVFTPNARLSRPVQHIPCCITHAKHGPHYLIQMMNGRESWHAVAEQARVSYRGGRQKGRGRQKGVERDECKLYADAEAAAMGRDGTGKNLSVSPRQLPALTNRQGSPAYRLTGHRHRACKTPARSACKPVRRTEHPLTGLQADRPSHWWHQPGP